MARSTQAIQEAQRVLNECGVERPPVDPRKIADQLGVEVRYEPLEEISGLTFHSERGNRIVVNSKHSSQRQRFTLAHELGHHLLHRGRQLVVDSELRVSARDDLSSLATDRQEIEANGFAAELLMPKKLVFAALDQLLAEGDSLTPDDARHLLADRFQVSEEAMNYRLINLGVLAPQ